METSTATTSHVTKREKGVGDLWRVERKKEVYEISYMYEEALRIRQGSLGSLRTGGGRIMRIRRSQVRFTCDKLNLIAARMRLRSTKSIVIITNMPIQASTKLSEL